MEDLRFSFAMTPILKGKLYLWLPELSICKSAQMSYILYIWRAISIVIECTYACRIKNTLQYKTCTACLPTGIICRGLHVSQFQHHVQFTITKYRAGGVYGQIYFLIQIKSISGYDSNTYVWDDPEFLMMWLSHEWKNQICCVIHSTYITCISKLSPKNW